MDEDAQDLTVHALAWIGAASAAAVLLALVLLFTIDLSFFLRHPIEQALSHQIGRRVLVNGEVRLVIWRHPALRIGDLFIANAGDGSRPDLIRAKRVEARLSFQGFPKTHLILGDISADNASLTLERTPSGMSWIPAPAAGAFTPRMIAVRGVPFPVDFSPRSLTVTNLAVGVRLPWQATAMTYPVDRLALQTGGPLGAYLSLVGHLGNETWRADADLSSFKALLSGAAFKIRARISGLGAQMNFAGFASFDANKATNLFGIGVAKDTRRLWAGPKDAPPTPANFTLSLKNSAQEEIVLVHFEKLGSGDLDVALQFDGAARDRLSGHVTAKTLDLAALPHPVWQIKGKTLFSERQMELKALKHSQIDVKVAVQSVSWREKKLGRLEFGVWANNGILAAGPIKLDGPETQVSGDATFDMRAVPKLSISLKATLANLGALIAPSDDPAHKTRADLALEVLGTGQSMAQIMATSYGQTDVLIGPGDAGATLGTLLPVEVAFGLKKDHSLAPLPTDGRPLNLTCLVSRFDIAEGHATSRALYIDTSHATTTGEGAVNFTNESLDFHLAPRPKDPDLIGQARDIDLRGTLAEPVFSPQDVATKGLSRSASETALAPASNIIMPLLAPEAVLANPCVRSLMSESALAGLRGRPPLKSASRAEGP